MGGRRAAIAFLLALYLVLAVGPLLAQEFPLKDEVCWLNPTENVDGTELVDLVAVTLYFGPRSRDYEHQRRIETTEPGQNECFRLRYQLPPGSWYVSATATDAEDNESGFSNEIWLRIPDRTPGRAVVLDDDDG